MKCQVMGGNGKHVAIKSFKIEVSQCHQATIIDSSCLTD
jgi:hypothetical protein